MRISQHDHFATVRPTTFEHGAVDPQAVAPRDVEMLQDLVKAAVNQGLLRAQEMAQEAMQQAVGLPLGGLMDMLSRSR